MTTGQRIAAKRKEYAEYKNAVKLPELIKE